MMWLSPLSRMSVYHQCRHEVQSLHLLACILGVMDMLPLDVSRGAAYTSGSIYN